MASIVAMQPGDQAQAHQVRDSQAQLQCPLQQWLHIHVQGQNRFKVQQGAHISSLSYCNANNKLSQDGNEDGLEERIHKNFPDNGRDLEENIRKTTDYVTSIDAMQKAAKHLSIALKLPRNGEKSELFSSMYHQDAPMSSKRAYRQWNTHPNGPG